MILNLLFTKKVILNLLMLKSLIVGCLYRHPSSSITVDQFTNDYIEPLLQNISNENKTCALMGDFNIDLIKKDSINYINNFCNTMSSNFFTPYILQPTLS